MNEKESVYVAYCKYAYPNDIDSYKKSMCVLGCFNKIEDAINAIDCDKNNVINDISKDKYEGVFKELIDNTLVNVDNQEAVVDSIISKRYPCYRFVWYVFQTKLF